MGQKGLTEMRHKLIGITAVAILFLFATAGSALADGIHGHDSDSDGSRFAADVSTSTIHDASVTKDAFKDQDPGKLHYDHVVAWSPDSHSHAHPNDGDDPDDPPTVPEPSALLLLATGLTPLLCVRRKSGV